MQINSIITNPSKIVYVKITFHSPCSHVPIISDVNPPPNRLATQILLPSLHIVFSIRQKSEFSFEQPHKPTRHKLIINNFFTFSSFRLFPVKLLNHFVVKKHFIKVNFGISLLHFFNKSESGSLNSILNF